MITWLLLDIQVKLWHFIVAPITTFLLGLLWRRIVATLKAEFAAMAERWV